MKQIIKKDSGKWCAWHDSYRLTITYIICFIIRDRDYEQLKSYKRTSITMASHERHVVSKHRSFDCFFTAHAGPHQRNIKVCITGPLWGEFTGDRWIQRTSNAEKSYLMTSSWSVEQFSTMKESFDRSYGLWCNLQWGLFYKHNCFCFVSSERVWICDSKWKFKDKLHNNADSRVWIHYTNESSFMIKIMRWKIAFSVTPL